MIDGNGLAEVLLGLPGFRVLEVIETPGELVVTIESNAVFVGCLDMCCHTRPARFVDLVSNQQTSPTGPVRGEIIMGEG